jgi:MFS transporter, ACS family, D-galactonate transporter
MMVQMGVHYDRIPLFFAGCSAIYVLGTCFIGLRPREEVKCIAVQ